MYGSLGDHWVDDLAISVERQKNVRGVCLPTCLAVRLIRSKINRLAYRIVSYRKAHRSSTPLGACHMCSMA